MTAQEFSIEFDIFYNNIRSASAPGLDEYEKSVFLTESQEELVRNIYKGLTVKQEGFEDVELARRKLDRLVKQYTSLNSVTNVQNISSNSTFFEIPEDVFVIVNESVLLESDISCWNNMKIDVIPMRHDEYNLQKKNPFRKPKLTGLTVNAWRIDYGDTDFRNVEIVYPVDSTPVQYIVRYVRKPKPIILQDLQPLDLSIDGETGIQTSELDSSFHRQIMINAVMKAKQVYDPKVNKQ